MPAEDPRREGSLVLLPKSRSQRASVFVSPISQRPLTTRTYIQDRGQGLPRPKRWATFPLEPLAVLNDPAFIRMGEHPQRERAQLCYVFLLFAAWSQKEPGVFPYAPMRLAHICNVSLEQWQEIEHLLVAGFTIREEDGAWTFPVMMRTAAEQNKNHKRFSLAGSNGGKAKARNALNGVARLGQVFPLKPSLPLASSASASASSLTEEEKAGATPRKRGSGRPDSFPADVLDAMQAKYPEVDVALVAAKLLNHPKSYRNWAKALDNWCAGAKSGGWDRRGNATDPYGDAPPTVVPREDE